MEPKGARLVVTMCGVPGTQVAQSLAPGIPGDEPWHTLRVRRQAAATRFVAVYQILPAGKAPERVTFTDDRITVGKATVLLGASEDGALALQ